MRLEAVLERDVAAAVEELPGFGHILRTQLRRGDGAERVGPALFAALLPFEQREGLAAPFGGGLRRPVVQVHLRLGGVGDGEVHRCVDAFENVDGGMHVGQPGLGTFAVLLDDGQLVEIPSFAQPIAELPVQRQRRTPRNRRVVVTLDVLALQGVRHMQRGLLGQRQVRRVLERQRVQRRGLAVGARLRGLACGLRRQRQHGARQAGPGGVVDQPHHRRAARAQGIEHGGVQRGGATRRERRLDGAARQLVTKAQRAALQPQQPGGGARGDRLRGRRRPPHRAPRASICVGETLASSITSRASARQRRDARQHRVAHRRRQGLAGRRPAAR